MGQCISQSSLFKENPQKTIFNTIDTNRFTPLPQQYALSLLGISTSKKIILLGAQYIHDFYKGFDLFKKALSFLDPEEYLILLFGKSDTNPLETSGFQIHSTGYIQDQEILQAAYSVASVFVAPSIIEAFGKTIVEAMSCETPVVAFDATGPQTIIEHNVNGYLATPFDERSLAHGIEWACSHNQDKKLSKLARKRAVTYFDNTVVAGQYIELYKEVLENAE